MLEVKLGQSDSGLELAHVLCQTVQHLQGTEHTHALTLEFGH
jgi:hypothetical protein